MQGEEKEEEKDCERGRSERLQAHEDLYFRPQKQLFHRIHFIVVLIRLLYYCVRFSGLWHMSHGSTLNTSFLMYQPQPESLLPRHVDMLLISHAELGGQTQFLQPKGEDEAWRSSRCRLGYYCQFHSPYTSVQD